MTVVEKDERPKIESTHNERFLGLMDRFMPDWRNRRDTLNSLPVRHETWGY